MADDRFPFGPEINDVGSETNASYYSDVSGSKGSYKNSTGSDNNLSELTSNNQLASQIEADTFSTVSSVESIGSSSVSSATDVAGSTASVAGTATAAAGATVVAVTIGVISTGAAIAQAIFGRQFYYSSSMEDRSIYYSLEMECQKDSLIYVHLLDEQDNEVAIEEHEITTSSYVDEPDMEKDNMYYISGEFHDLHYQNKYRFEAYYFEGEQRFTIYEEKDIQIEYIPYKLGETTLSYDSSMRTADFSFYYYFVGEGKEVAVSFSDINQEVTYEDRFLTNKEEAVTDYGEEYYYAHHESHATGLVPGETYQITLNIDNEELYDNTFTMPEIEPQVVLDDFSYTSDMYERSIEISYQLTVKADETIYFDLYDETDELVSSKTREISIENGESIGITEAFTDLHYRTNYRLLTYYVDGVNQIDIHEVSDLSIEYKPYSVSSFEISLDSPNHKANVNFNYTFDSRDEDELLINIVENDELVKSITFAHQIDPENPGYIDYGDNFYQMNYQGEITDLLPSHTYQLDIVVKQSYFGDTMKLFSQEIVMPSIEQHVFIDEGNFSYESDMDDKVISYFANVRLTQDETIYVTLYDEDEEIVGEETHVLDIQEAIQEDDQYYYEIEGSFSSLHYHQKYNIEIYYFEGLEKVSILSKKDLEIEYTANTVTDLSFTPDAPNKSVSISFDMTYDADHNSASVNIINAKEETVFTQTVTGVIPTNISGANTLEEESSEIIDLGDGLYRATFSVIATDIDINQTYSISVLVGEESTAILEDTFEMPDVPQDIHLEEISHTSDTISQSMTFVSTLSFTEANTVHVSLYDSEDNLIDTHDHDLTPSEAGTADINSVELEDEFTGLDYEETYRLKIYYSVGLIDFVIHEESDIAFEVVANNVTNIDYQFDSQRKSMRISTDLTFMDEEQQIDMLVVDPTGETIYEESFITSIDESNPGYHDYGQGLYGITFTSGTIKGLQENTEYVVKYLVNEETFHQESFAFPESESGYAPYVSLDTYEVDYDNKSVNLTYTYIDNGVTYSYFVMEITNLNTSETTTYQFASMEDGNVIVDMERLGIGYTYRFNLCGVDENENQITLAQNAIYY